MHDSCCRHGLRQLQALGFVTLEAENGVEAIALLDTGVDVDVVLSDVVMPGGICGYDVAEWVQRQRPECHVLLTSGFNDPSDHSGEVGVTGLHVLQKPYHLDELRKTLHDVMDCHVVRVHQSIGHLRLSSPSLMRKRPVNACVGARLYSVTGDSLCWYGIALAVQDISGKSRYPGSCERLDS